MKLLFVEPAVPRSVSCIDQPQKMPYGNLVLPWSAFPERLASHLNSRTPG